MSVSCLNWLIERAIGEIRLGRIPCMRGAEMVDMSSTMFSVEHMSKMIQVRNVPDELHRALKLRATAEGMTLSDYIKRELGYVAGKSTIEEIGARNRMRGPSGLKTETTVELIREARGE
jgi:antitoxin FitA